MKMWREGLIPATLCFFRGFLGTFQIPVICVVQPEKCFY